MRLAYVTETYPPEINGVALTVDRFVHGLRTRGHTVDLVRPRQPHESECETRSEWRSPGIPLPMYRDLRIGLPLISRLTKRWSVSRPQLVHVATEGPLGWAAIRAARTIGVPVTSDFRTNFDQYSEHYGLGWLRGIVGGYLKHFHNATDRTFVPTLAVSKALTQQGFERTEVIGRGVDPEKFSPLHASEKLRAGWRGDERTPVLLYVGRLASEKNVPLAFRAFEAVRARVPDAAYHPDARAITLAQGNVPVGNGTILIVCAGTSDLGVAEEAAITAEMMGNRIDRLYDVGVAGLHRLLSEQARLQDAQAIVVIAGMEGALPSVVAGLVSTPVIAVPTSVGYGASFGGVAALLGMLNSCANGVAVVNIDNGFGGACMASVINHL